MGHQPSGRITWIQFVLTVAVFAAIASLVAYGASIMISDIKAILER